MKKQTNKLFDLIKNLTKNEKRFFKLYSNFYNQDKDKNYLILFDILEGLKSYDEKIILAHISKQIHSKNISQIKTYLKKHIFLSLKLFHRNNIETVQHYDSLALASMLIERKEFVEATKLLSKMQKNAESNNNFQTLSEINFLILKTNSLQSTLEESSYKKSLEVASKLDESLQAHHSKIKIYALFMELRLLIETLPSIHPLSEQKINHFVENKLLPIDYSILPDIKSKTAYLQSLLIAYNYLGKYDELLLYSKKVVDLIENNSGILFKAEFCFYYTWLMQAYAMKKEKAALFEVDKKYSDLVEQNPSLQEFLDGRILPLCFYYRLCPELPLPPFFEQLISEYFKNQFEKADKDVCISTCNNVAQVYFCRKRFEEVQQTLDRYLLKHNLSTNNENYIPIILLNILCYIELNNSTFAQRELTNIKRKLKRQEIFHPTIETIIKQISNIIQQQNKSFKPDAYKKLIQVFEDNKGRKFFDFNIQFLKIWAVEKLQQS